MKENIELKNEINRLQQLVLDTEKKCSIYHQKYNALKLQIVLLK